MATRNRKNQAQTPEKGMEMIMATTPQLNIDDAAQQVGCAPIRLLELFAERLGTQEPMLWDSIPTEHESLLLEFKQQQDAFNSVRVLEAEKPTESIPEVTEQSVEPPMLDESENTSKPTSKRSKKGSTAITKKQAESLQKSDQKAQQLAASDVQIKQALHVKKGQKSGAQLATLELAAEDATYRTIKGQALVRKVAQLSSELVAESDFDPIQLLKEMGVDSNDEILETLREQIEPTLGKFETAVEEITANAWVNGIDLGTEFSQLENLLNSNY
jgi:hypothetical protein